MSLRFNIITLSHDRHGNRRLGNSGILITPHLGHSLDLGIEIHSLKTGGKCQLHRVVLGKTFQHAVIRKRVVSHVTTTGISLLYQCYCLQHLDESFAFTDLMNTLYSEFDKHLVQVFIILLRRLYSTYLSHSSIGQLYGDRDPYSKEHHNNQTSVKEQNDQGLHCLPFRLHLLNAFINTL